MRYDQLVIDQSVQDKMREDWNSRAKEDAHYYVAFGRREQNEAEFASTAADVVRALTQELQRLPPSNSRRALEVGCGPGRLLKPMSAHFAEIHGVDVSDEMVKIAQERLRDVPHAHAYATSGSDLQIFDDDYFDFVYSYAVFQHIPSRDVVFSYLHEIARVLKPGGLVRCQVSGLPPAEEESNTWSGCRIGADEIAEFAMSNNLQLLALEGVMTQYMWVTMRKREAAGAGVGQKPLAGSQVKVRRVTNANNTEPVVPAGGRYACVSVWVEGLPAGADLTTTEVLFDGAPGFPSYLGPKAADGVQQLNVFLPPFGATGLLPVQVRYEGKAVGAPSILRVIPPSPMVPRVMSVTDGVNLLSNRRIETGIVKTVIEEVSHPEQFAAQLDGKPVENIQSFCTDPLSSTYEFTFSLPRKTAPGSRVLRLQLGRRQFAPVGVEVAAAVS